MFLGADFSCLEEQCERCTNPSDGRCSNDARDTLEKTGFGFRVGRAAEATHLGRVLWRELLECDNL